MFVSWGQALLGSRLRRLEGRTRRAVRRVHLATATLLVGLGVAHLLLNGPLVRSTLEPLQSALKDAKLDKSAISEVVLVGGSSRLPLVHQLLTEFFGKL